MKASVLFQGLRQNQTKRNQPFKNVLKILEYGTIYLGRPQILRNF